MIGIVLSGVGLGTMIMPPVADQLINTYGWRTSYIIIGVTVLVLITLAAQFVRRSPAGAEPIPCSELEAGQKSPDLEAKGLSFREATHTRQLWIICLMFMGFGIFQQAIAVHIVIHAIEIGISSARAAIILTIAGGLSIVGRVIMGITSDRIGSKWAIVICFGLSSVALFSLIRAEELWMFYLFAAVYGFTMVVWQPYNQQ